MFMSLTPTAHPTSFQPKHPALGESQRRTASLLSRRYQNPNNCAHWAAGAYFQKRSAILEEDSYHTQTDVEAEGQEKVNVCLDA